jgi:uncharacterized protein (TIGR02145 family)
LPGESEWSALIDYLGGGSVAGGKMKSTSGWDAPNTAATNESGFSALPGGYRHNSGPFFNGIGGSGYWWSSTEFNATLAWYHFVTTGNGLANVAYDDKPTGYSCRCLKD